MPPIPHSPQEPPPATAVRHERKAPPGSPFDGRHLLAQAAVVVATAAWWAVQVPAISAPVAPDVASPRAPAASMPGARPGPVSQAAPPHGAAHPPASHTPRRRQIAHAVAVARRHAPPQVQVGQASFYSHRLAGRPMASGRPFDPAQPVAASRTLPIGSTAKVTNLETGRSATVRIEDRGPVPRDRVVDVAPAVARQIGIDHRDGLAPVAVEPLSLPTSSPGRPPRLDDGTPAPPR